MKAYYDYKVTKICSQYIGWGQVRVRGVPERLPSGGHSGKLRGRGSPFSFGPARGNPAKKVAKCLRGAGNNIEGILCKKYAHVVTTQAPLTGEAAVRELMASLDANNNSSTTSVTVLDGAVAKQVPVVRKNWTKFF